MPRQRLEETVLEDGGGCKPSVGARTVLAVRLREQLPRCGARVHQGVIHLEEDGARHAKHQSGLDALNVAGALLSVFRTGSSMKSITSPQPRCVPQVHSLSVLKPMLLGT